MQTPPTEVLCELVDLALEPWKDSEFFRVAPPTPQSIRRAEAELAIMLPPLYIDLASGCKAFGAKFSGIGEDYDAQFHILGVRNHFREMGLPSHYVMFNHGHDGDCVC